MEESGDVRIARAVSQFKAGNTYHFDVRAVNKHGRIGPFSDPTRVVIPPKR